MNSPFQLITDAFQSDYCVNFSIERTDGSIVLTLSNTEGVAVKRFISAAQLYDEEKLQRLILSTRLGLAIESGQASPALFASVARTQQLAQRPHR